MGITSFAGMIVCFVAIVYGIISVGGDMGNFINLPSIILTVVPTIGAVVATFPLSLITQIPAHFKVILKKGYQLENYVDMLMDISQKTRKEGILTLEKEKVDDPFISYALRMIVDGLDETQIKQSLEETLEGTKNRHNEAITIYEKAAAYAPAFGMCATVIGLINMLMGLDFSDPNAINNLGGNMSMALITTFYGSLLANIVFNPIAGRLRTLHKKEIYCKAAIGNALLSVMRGENPTITRGALVEQLSTKSRKRFSGGGATA